MRRYIDLIAVTLKHSVYYIILIYAVQCTQ